MFDRNRHRPVILGVGGGFYHLAVLSALIHVNHTREYRPSYIDVIYHPTLTLETITEIERFHQNKIILHPFLKEPEVLSPIWKLLQNKKEPFSVVTIKNTFPRMPRELLEIKR